MDDHAGGVDQPAQAGPGHLAGQIGGAGGDGLGREFGLGRGRAVDDVAAQLVHALARGPQHQGAGQLVQGLGQGRLGQDLVDLGQAGERVLIGHGGSSRPQRPALSVRPRCNQKKARAETTRLWSMRPSATMAGSSASGAVKTSIISPSSRRWSALGAAFLAKKV